MKNKTIIFLILLIGLIALPFRVQAETKKYNVLNLKETLAEEELEEEFKNYKETDNQITIYLFRGKGCGYCRAFLTFLNSITEEYGKYFKLRSYEVWNDQNNSALMGEVSNYLGEPAGGVPYIIIGDKVFPGYASQYDENIKKAITDLYNTKKNKRYDVFTEMKKHSNTNETTSTNIIIWNLAFIALATTIVISYINLKFKELKVEINTKINDLNAVVTKPEPAAQNAKKQKTKK